MPRFRAQQLAWGAMARSVALALLTSFVSMSRSAAEAEATDQQKGGTPAITKEMTEYLARKWQKKLQNGEAEGTAGTDEDDKGDYTNVTITLMDQEVPLENLGSFPLRVDALDLETRAAISLKWYVEDADIKIDRVPRGKYQLRIIVDANQENAPGMEGDYYLLVPDIQLVGHLRDRVLVKALHRLGAGVSQSEVYVNEKYGVRFRPPEGWSVNEGTTAFQVAFFSDTSPSAPDFDSRPRIKLSVSEAEGGLLQQELERYLRNFMAFVMTKKGGSVEFPIGPAQEVIIGGKRGIQFHLLVKFGTGQQVRSTQYFFVENGLVYVLALDVDSGYFNELEKYMGIFDLCADTLRIGMAGDPQP